MDAELQKEKARTIYNQIQNPLWCPVLHAFVSFTAKGFHHLLYDGLGNKRYVKAQLYKIRLIPFISEALENGTVTSHRKISRKKDIEYWGIESMVGESKNTKIRVIIRKEGNGKILFWSVMGLKSNKKNLL